MSMAICSLLFRAITYLADQGSTPRQRRKNLSPLRGSSSRNVKPQPSGCGYNISPLRACLWTAKYVVTLLQGYKNGVASVSPYLSEPSLTHFLLRRQVRGRTGGMPTCHDRQRGTRLPQECRTPALRHCRQERH